METKKENGKKWKYITIFVLAVVLSVIAFAMVMIGTTPKPKITLSNERILFEGDSGQTPTTKIQLNINTKGSQIDVFNISGNLYQWVFDYENVTYVKQDLPIEYYKNLYIYIDNNTKLDFSRGYVVLNPFNTNVLPIVKNTDLNITFGYGFPSVGCSCNSKHCMYIFEINIREGFIG